MGSNDVNWIQAVEKLLVPQRGVSSDGKIFTQQAHAGVFCKAYRQASNVQDRRSILAHLISKYGHSNVTEISLPPEANDKWFADVTRLLKDLPPPYLQLFRATGQLEGGIKFLVDMRADILTWIREQHDTIGESTVAGSVRLPSLKLMNDVLRDLLGVWFSIGLLHVERVTWSSPCDLLQRVADYESVHPVRSWTDLKSRVGPRRRCFVFTHPSMPREPLVVLHVALTDRIAEKISEVISAQRHPDRDSKDIEEDLNNVTTAIFYSISSTQPGLQGIDLGHFMIKRVVQQLSAELHSINAFSSLSPIPGFRKWLMEEMRRKAKGGETRLPMSPTDAALLAELLTEQNQWYADESLRTQLRPILLRTCAYYLLNVKHRGHAYDPVANFHLRNGAVLWRLNWEGDSTTKGLNQSCSLMVNYRYYLNQTEENSRLYLDKKEIQAADQVKNLLNAPQFTISNL